MNSLSHKYLKHKELYKSLLEFKEYIVMLDPSLGEKKTSGIDLGHFDREKYTKYYKFMSGNGELRNKLPFPLSTPEEAERNALKFRQSSAYFNELSEMINPGKKDEERFLSLTKFQPFESLEEIFKEWDCAKGGRFEVKFVKPSNLADWQSTIYRCSTIIKVFKTLEHFLPTSTHKFKFHYISKLLYKRTTHVFQYDPNNFSFIVTTGWDDWNRGTHLINTSIPIYDFALDQLHSLIETMKVELPSAQFETVFALYNVIKLKRTV